MVENKATALKHTNYNIKLILGSDPKHPPKLIDITDAVIENMSYDEVFPDDSAEYGIVYKIIGVLEESSNPGYLASTPLRTDRNSLFLIQDIYKILEASIVNAKQLEAIKGLVNDVFEKNLNDNMSGVDSAIQACIGEVAKELNV